MRKRDTSIFAAKFQGKVMKSDIPSVTCYDETGNVRRFTPGTFVPNDVIQKFKMRNQWFIHPGTLRIAGAFEFAHKKKGKFSVGITRMLVGRGDILMASVLAKALKYRYGDDVQCWFAIREEYKPILENNPFVDRVYGSKDELAKAKPDVSLNVDDLEFKVEKKDFEKNNMVTRNRASIYLEQLGLYLENKTPVYIVTDKEKEWAKKKLKELGYTNDSPIVGVQLYGSNPSRTYPFMDKVIEELEKDKQVFSLDKTDNNQNYLYNLREVGALINEMDLVVTPNSFFYHLAGALKKHGVAIFGYTDGEIWTEDYERITPLEIECPEGKQKCWWRIECNPGDTLKEKERKVPPCLRKVSPDAVCEAVDAHLENKRKILVVVLTYNFANMSIQMVDSIRSFHDYDIVVIDNKSTDETAKWAKEEGLEFINKKQSVAAAWNMGLKLAYDRGYDYCLLCNNDIVLSPTYIDTCVEVLERRKVFAVTGNVIDNVVVRQPNLKFQQLVKQLEVPIMGQKAGDYSALLVSRKCIETVGKFNEIYGPRYQADEDHLLRVRLASSDVIRTYATNFLHLLGQVIKKVPEARATHLSDWERNTKLFKKMWNVDLYTGRQVFNNIDEIKRRNPDWQKRILLPLNSKFGGGMSRTPDCLRNVVEGLIHKESRPIKVYITRRMGGYGDILFTTVLARALKEEFGMGVTVHYGVLEPFAPLLEGNPYIDKVLNASPREFIPAGYDYTLDLTDYEYQTELREIENWGKITRARTRIYLDLAGLEGSLKPDYFPTEREREWAAGVWKRNGNSKRVVVVEKGSNLMKVWPGMPRLFRQLKTDGHNVLMLDKKQSTNYRYSFRQSAAIVSAADLVITPDSGISNLAGTLDVPVVTVFANRNGEIFAKMFNSMTPIQGKCPIHKRGYCEFNADCFRGSLHEYRAKENRRIPDCLKNLTFKEVYNEVREKLGK